MRIKSVGIENFRCLQDVRIDLDSVTTLIGPNGAGKSSVLRALNWFFNGDPVKLTDDDVYSGAAPDDRRIVVEVVFTDLTERDRAELGPRYAPAGTTTFTAWRTWQDDTDKMTGKARAFLPFEEVRAAIGLKGKKPLYEAIIEGEQDIGLPKWTTLEEVDQAMKVWEEAHADRLEDAVVDSTYLFGFNGQNKLSGLFDYVLVTGDLRAGEESQEGKNTIIGRILERAVSRESANEAFALLATEVSQRQAEISAEHLGDQLNDLAVALTAEVSAFTSGRAVRLQASSPDVRPSPARISVFIADALVVTSVERQGHGFQRALLIASLKLLARRGSADNDGSVILLGIEEPELFQHPSQARVFANVLRELADEPGGGLQVAYATHSPYFVDARYFDQVRRVTRTRPGDSEHARVYIYQASLDAVEARLDGYATSQAIRSRWDQVCTKNLAEALFADAVVLVEGDDDKGILDGIAARAGQRQFESDGITVAHANGKGHLITPHAILTGLNIPTLTVFDSDSGAGARMRACGNRSADTQEATNAELNRKLLRYFGLPEEDFPSGALTNEVYVWDDDLEHVVERDWKDWERTRADLVNRGLGVNGKNAATYALAARKCPEDPSGALLEVVAAARALVRADRVVATEENEDIG